MNVGSVREAMSDALSEINSSIYVYEKIPKQPTILPCLIVYPPDRIDYMRTRGLAVAEFAVLALVGPQDESAQVVLEDLMSSEGTFSVMAKLYEDRQLGGAASNLRLLDSSSGLYSITVGTESSVIGCEFRVEVSG